MDEAHGELDALRKFSKHENIVSLLDHCSFTTKHQSSSSGGSGSGSRRTVMFLFPLYSRGTVWDEIEHANTTNPDYNGPWPYNERRSLRICQGMANALAFMHNHGDGSTHRDVKPHNVLLSSDDQAVLTDF